MVETSTNESLSFVVMSNRETEKERSKSERIFSSASRFILLPYVRQAAHRRRPRRRYDLSLLLLFSHRWRHERFSPFVRRISLKKSDVTGSRQGYCFSALALDRLDNSDTHTPTRSMILFAEWLTMKNLFFFLFPITLSNLDYFSLDILDRPI